MINLQPPSGLKDLNPQQVELNHYLINKLSEVYNLWGYEEVNPPKIERLSTLMAGGAILNEDIVKVVSDESLGLRPEMTASIARAACTKFSNRKLPLRFWAAGTVFESRQSTEGHTLIEELIQSNVELIGVKDIYAEIELLSLILNATNSININDEFNTTLLVGHNDIIKFILSNFEQKQSKQIKKFLIDFNRIGLQNMDLSDTDLSKLLDILRLRGNPLTVINQLEKLLGSNLTLDKLNNIFSMILPLANEHNIKVLFDPTFQSQYDLYNGIVFQMICTTNSSPIVIARGGRYDKVLERFGANEEAASGAGFSFSIDKIREFINNDIYTKPKKVITIAYSSDTGFGSALLRQRDLHKNGIRANIAHTPYKNFNEASDIVSTDNNIEIDWIG
tara:strand:+ start:989 stop:2164 length:1176 start_codon:yes stop_codon:yes gene_type:complete